jgi:hypothetical protein
MQTCSKERMGFPAQLEVEFLTEAVNGRKSAEHLSQRTSRPPGTMAARRRIQAAAACDAETYVLVYMSLPPAHRTGSSRIGFRVAPI